MAKAAAFLAGAASALLAVWLRQRQRRRSDAPEPIQKSLRDGRQLVLRGATLTAGGTAEKIAASIEKKLFVHGRSLLAGWKAEHEKLFGDGSWEANGGADAESIGLHRLSENTLLMSDTCNGARATKRLLAAMAELEGQKKIGTEAWEAMSKVGPSLNP